MYISKRRMGKGAKRRAHALMIGNVFRVTSLCSAP